MFCRNCGKELEDGSLWKLRCKIDTGDLSVQ